MVTQPNKGVVELYVSAWLVPEQAGTAIPTGTATPPVGFPSTLSGLIGVRPPPLPAFSLTHRVLAAALVLSPGGRIGTTQLGFEEPQPWAQADPDNRQINDAIAHFIRYYP